MTKFEDKKFAEYVRQQECVVCEGGDWHWTTGRWKNTPSHINARGMGGANKQEYENLVPMCFSCHRRYEDTPKPSRIDYTEQAIQVYHSYLQSCKVN